jgi:hypothetical protein
MRMKIVFLAAALTGGLAIQAVANPIGRRTMIYDGKTSEIEASPIESGDLWITTADLSSAAGFVIKPQGVCRDELCFPLPKSRQSEFVSKRGSVTWFNLTAFAALIKQPVAHDIKNGVWVFGRRSDIQNNLLNTLEAPDFKLADMNGSVHSLSDFRGKKVLLVTWASW